MVATTTRPAPRARIGVLAVQGAFAAHEAVLAGLDALPVLVRDPEPVASLDGLILPGGESTAMTLLMKANGLWTAIADYLAARRPVLATCAGAILIADRVLDGRPDQESLHAVAISVRRNGFGRQSASFEAPLELGDSGPPFPGVFIRAPLIEQTGEGVSVLARLGPDQGRAPVLCRSGSVLVTTFHPELTADTRIHQLAFPGLAGTSAASGASASASAATGARARPAAMTASARTHAPCPA